jgi:hypothetical protein
LNMTNVLITKADVGEVTVSERTFISVWPNF